MKAETTSKDQASGGKPKMSLLPPYSLTVITRAMEKGARDFGRYDYLRGYPYSLYDDAIHRHLMAWRGGEDIDPSSGLPHLAHAAACAMILLEMQAIEVGSDDRKKQIASPRKAG